MTEKVLDFQLVCEIYKKWKRFPLQWNYNMKVLNKIGAVAISSPQTANNGDVLQQQDATS